MKTGRVQHTARLVCGLLALGMLLFVSRLAAAQSSPSTVLMTDFVNVHSHYTDALAIQAMQSVVKELEASGKDKYRLLVRAEVLMAAQRLHIELPSDPWQPANLTEADWFRLSRALKADCLITGEINLINRKQGKTRSVIVVISLLLRDSAEGNSLNGGREATLRNLPYSPAAQAEAMRETVEEGASLATREMLQRFPPITTVVDVQQKKITLRGGVREGLTVGDKLNIFHKGADGTIRTVGTIRLTQVDLQGSKGKVVTNSGICPDDVACKLYVPISFYVPLKSFTEVH